MELRGQGHTFQVSPVVDVTVIICAVSSHGLGNVPCRLFMKMYSLITNQSPGPKIVHVDNREQITWQFLNGQMTDVLSIQRLLKLVACKDFPVWLCAA